MRMTEVTYGYLNGRSHFVYHIDTTPQSGRELREMEWIAANYALSKG